MAPCVPRDDRALGQCQPITQASTRVTKKLFKNGAHSQDGRAAIHRAVIDLTHVHLAAWRSRALQHGDAEPGASQINARG